MVVQSNEQSDIDIETFHRLQSEQHDQLVTTDVKLTDIETGNLQLLYDRHRDGHDSQRVDQTQSFGGEH